jgi:hypothetical protein
MSRIQRVWDFRGARPMLDLQQVLHDLVVPASYLPCVAWYAMKNSLANKHACER